MEHNKLSTAFFSTMLHGSDMDQLYSNLKGTAKKRVESVINLLRRILFKPTNESNYMHV